MTINIITEALCYIAQITMYIILTCCTVSCLLLQAVWLWKNRKKGERKLPSWIKKLY